MQWSLILLLATLTSCSTENIYRNCVGQCSHSRSTGFFGAGPPEQFTSEDYKVCVDGCKEIMQKR